MTSCAEIRSIFGVSFFITNLPDQAMQKRYMHYIKKTKKIK